MTTRGCGVNVLIQQYYTYAVSRVLAVQQRGLGEGLRFAIRVKVRQGLAKGLGRG